MPTLRAQVLDAIIRLEHRHGREVFDLAEIVQEVRARNADSLEVSVRTQITSVMCREAPIHHANHSNDLERVSRGRYRRLAEWPESTMRPREVTAGRQLTAETSEWPWEGAVQAVLVTRLVANGWHIERQADTATGEHGADIVAVRDGVRLLVEVKGYPLDVYQRGPRAGEPKKTNPVLQARHWFAGAVLTALLHRSEEPDARVVIAVPSYLTYKRLAQRTAKALAMAGVEVWLLDDPSAS